MCFKRIKEIFEKNNFLFWSIIILIPLVIITVGCIIFPEIFWDKFIWKYYWGPIEADAKGESVDGIKAGYNVVNTITYALFLTLFLFGFYILLKKLKVAADIFFLFAVSPFIVLGAVYRVLEDSELFKKPFIYLFISPIIYVIIALITIFFLLVSVYVDKEFEKRGLKHGIIILVGFIIFLDFGYIFIYLFMDKYFNYLIHPFWMILVSNAMIILRLLIYSRLKKIFDTNAVLFTGGSIMLSLGFYYIGHWLFFDQWGDGGSGVKLHVLPIIIILSVVATFILFLITESISKKYSNFYIFSLGINIALIYAHFLDATATFIGIDYYGYSEKHVLPNFLISLFDTAIIMFVLKAVVICLVIYLIDIVYKEELKDNELLIGLVKIFVFILGFAPGCRDMIRLAMGV